MVNGHDSVIGAPNLDCFATLSWWESCQPMVGSCSWVVRGNDKGAKVMSRGKNRSQGKIQIHSARLFPPLTSRQAHILASEAEVPWPVTPKAKPSPRSQELVICRLTTKPPLGVRATSLGHDHQGRCGHNISNNKSMDRQGNQIRKWQE